MIEDVQLVDLRAEEKAGDSVAILYFHELQGSIHIYRDGVVILSSPQRTTTVSLKQPNESRYRRTEFLRLLTHLGATDDDLIAVDERIGQQDGEMNDLDFAAAIHKATVASETHMQDWCEKHNLDYGAMDEEEIDQIIEQAIAQVRS